MLQNPRFKVLEELFLRHGFSKQSEFYREYYWQSVGQAGEEEMYAWLKERLPKQADIMHDLTLDYTGLTQCDFLVQAEEIWWLIEVKNYHGLTEYINNCCYLRGNELRSDQFAAMRNRVRIIENLANRFSKDVKVISTMIFIHPDAEVNWDSDETFAILTRNQINNYITNMLNNYDFTRPAKNSSRKFIDAYLESYPQKAITISDDIHNSLCTGCRCPKCQSYMLSFERKSVECQECGLRLKKEILVRESYKQLSLLNYFNKKKITIQQLFRLCNYKISRRYIQRIMKPYRVKDSQSVASYYYNYYEIIDE